MVGRNKPHFLAMLILLAVIFLATSEIVSYKAFATFAIANNSYFYFWPLTQLPVILIGCVFFFSFLNGDSAVREANSWILGVLFFTLSAVGLVLGTSGNLSPGLAPVVFAVAFCCLALLAAFDRFGLIANRWISHVGVCSYSIYLVHFAVIDVARVVLKELDLSKVQAGIILLSVIYISVAAVSYYIAIWTRRLIELPSIEIGRRLSIRLLSK
jgi:peptidoglycan/LPS O-acetylase OafA/YrhL